MIFDSHAHYDDKAFDADRKSHLESLPAAGIGAVVDVGADRSSTEKAAQLAQSYDYVYASAGIHPNEVAEFESSRADIKWLKDAAKKPKVVAIGEIGLDYHWPDYDKEVQKKWFLAQLEAAKELGLPVIIHSRDAAAETFGLLKEAKADGLPVVMHCFSYEKEMAARFLDMGFYLGIGGVVTYKNARKLKEVAEYMPLDRMLLETDCPYLTPTPHRGKRNSSLYLPNVLDELAAIRGISAKDVEEATWRNAKEFYNI